MKPLIVFSLYCGRDSNTRPSVTDAELADWLEAIVSPELGSFTVTDAVGYWDGKRERSIRLEVWTDSDPFDVYIVRENLRKLAADYVARFGQQAVGLGERTELVEFIAEGKLVQ